MKNLVRLVVAGAVVFGASVAMASEDTAPALVIKDGYCGLLDGLGNVVTAESSHQVISMDANGNVVLKCSSKNVEPTEQKAVNFDYEMTGLTCNTAYGATTDWKNTVTPSGKSTLTCIIHPKQAEE